VDEGRNSFAESGRREVDNAARVGQIVRRTITEQKAGLRMIGRDEALTSGIRPFPFTKVMVTGGAGFIGSRVVSMLTSMKVQQVVVDNLYVGIPLPEAGPYVIPVNADIRDAEAMNTLMREHRPEAILHLAAVHHIPTCEANPALALDVNITGTQVVLDAAAAAGVSNFVFTSSGAVYQWLDGFLLEEETPTGWSDVYSLTKLSGEYLVRNWANRTGSRAHIGRLFNTIGTGDPNGHLIPDLMQQLGGGSSAVTVKLGNTKPKRDYIHVEDVARAFIALMGGIAEGEPVEAFNICSGNELSVAELVELTADVLGVGVTIEIDPQRIRKIDRLQQLGSPAKIGARRNWKATKPVRTALIEIMDDLGYTARSAA